MENIYAELLNELKENRAVTVETRLAAPEGSLKEKVTRRFAQVEPVEDAHGRRFARVSTQWDEDGSVTIREPVLPQERLIVLGGGHIALPVCEFGAKCGFQVCVVDDRPSFANAARFPLAQQVLCESFETAIEKLQVTAFDYVVVITRGHKHDADCLRVLLPGQAPAYLGMIGSRRRVRGLMEMLKEEGFDEAHLNSICTPIGLNIGAVTPGEIAISIMAEVIAHKRLPEYGDASRYCIDSDLELSTMEYLAGNREPKAVVTVIETKGSTPRGTGAKMAVSPIGQVTGSIGGGCSEAAVIRDAIAIIGTGKYKLMDIDLTGEVAESDGMVCGGTMKVLIEDGCC